MTRTVAPFARVLLALGLGLVSASIALPAHAADPKAKKVAKKAPPKKGAKGAKPAAKADEDPDFKARFAAVSKAAGKTIAVKMKPEDDPNVIPENALPPGLVVVAGQRRGIYVPPTLSPDDMMSVVGENMVIIRKCYKKQLADDPEWEGEAIIDLSVKKTGRVSEVEVAPRRVRRDPIGECLMSEIPKWKFPEFTGEIDDGVSQEVVNTSVPLTFSQPR